MKKIKIWEEFANTDEMANTLEIIANLIKEGYTSGYYPAWEVVEQPVNHTTDEN